MDTIPTVLVALWPLGLCLGISLALAIPSLRFPGGGVPLEACPLGLLSYGRQQVQLPALEACSV